MVALRARKHEVVAAGEADSYLWSSRPLAADDGMTLWTVPAHAPDLFVPARTDGAGPYGSATSTVLADPVLVPADAMLGEDGAGLGIVLGTVLPWLLELRGPSAATPSTPRWRSWPPWHRTGVLPAPSPPEGAAAAGQSRPDAFAATALRYSPVRWVCLRMISLAR